MTISVVQGDCVEVLCARTGPLFDACVTDPPYHLLSTVERFSKVARTESTMPKSDPHARMSRGFMGKTWDGGDIAFRPETWRAVFDQLKPGAHLVAFSGTRTYHRMAVAIEDAGFEIRQMLAWTFGSGFPKSHNAFKVLSEKGLCCTCPRTILSSHHVSEQDLHDLCAAVDANGSLSGEAESDVQPSVQGYGDSGEQDGTDQARASVVRDVREADNPSPPVASGEAQVREPVLQQAVLGVDARGSHAGDLGEGIGCDHASGSCSGRAQGGGEPCVERRRDAQACEGELYRRALRASAGMGEVNGASGRLRRGASSCDGATVRIPTDTDGGGSSSRPQSGKQRSRKSGTMADQRGSSPWGGWPVCSGCQKPIIPEGMGTDVKPAFEPICFARKPIAEPNIAANVLAHGTGGLNIEACRIEGGERPLIQSDASTVNGAGALHGGGIPNGSRSAGSTTLGRFPANLLHDGSAEVEALFPDAGGGFGKRGGNTSRTSFGFDEGTMETVGFGDSGSAARFFYSAKAGPLDRLGTEHPTVKPVDVMRWLVRLVAPRGSLILDPFAGSGTTGIAALAEGINAELIDIEADHVADIETKLAHLRGEGARIVERHLKRKAARAAASTRGALL